MIARAPTHRPKWFVVLAGLMLLAASRLVLAGLDTLAHPPTAAPVSTVGARTPEEAVALTLAQATAAAQANHRGWVRVHATAKLALACVILYAVASAFSLDPRGRHTAMAAGWLGIAYQGLDLVYSLSILRGGVLEAAPAIVSALVRLPRAGEPLDPGAARAAIEVASWLIPLAAAVTGVVFFGLVVAFFGGRRGKLLYGLLGPMVGGHGR